MVSYYCCVDECVYSVHSVMMPSKVQVIAPIMLNWVISFYCVCGWFDVGLSLAIDGLKTSRASNEAGPLGQAMRVIALEECE